MGWGLLGGGRAMSCECAANQGLVGVMLSPRPVAWLHHCTNSTPRRRTRQGGMFACAMVRLCTQVRESAPA
jgi:hypothetical protein